MNSRGGPSEFIWYCIRRNGVARRKGWTRGVNVGELRRHIEGQADESVEVCVATKFRVVTRERLSQVFFNRVRGVVGMEIKLADAVSRIAPTQMIANNLGFDRALDRFHAEQGIDSSGFATRGMVRAFSAEQFLLPGGDGNEPVKLYRGSTTVDALPPAENEHAAGLVNGIGHWMIQNQSNDGRIPYKYWPSRGMESPADNAIRNFLASWSLARLAKFRRSARLGEAARRNLRFNLSRYFQHIGNGRGAIVESTGAKLGASAVAGLAILEASDGQEFLEELGMLAEGINSLADEDSGFRTFFFPRARDGDNWNFYSGEALLFWAEATRLGIPEAPTLAQCANTFELCRARHKRKRNPAFVPWHTQACASLFAQTGRREFADFAFELNDWLLPMQQWDGLPPDMRGRFYDPARPDFGPPHAASTGAYVEGIAEAAALAHTVGDHARASSYELAISRGLRSLRQLQFRDARDAFYVSKRNRVMGALRTEVYDNAVRVDSAAHALLAAMKILQPAIGVS